MTLAEIKAFLKVGQKRRISEKLEDLTLTAIASQSDSRGIKKTSKELERLIDKIDSN